MKTPWLIDFETKSIADFPRPKSPPPVGLAIKPPGKPSLYLAWDHPTENGVYTLSPKGKAVRSARTDDPRSMAIDMLRDAYKDSVLGHNLFKFDLPVAEDHLRLKPPSWEFIHDTLFTLFLRDPHSNSLSLKPAAEFWLEEKPDERDAVYDWLIGQGLLPKAGRGVTCVEHGDSHKGVHEQNRNCKDPVFVRNLYHKEAGAHICKAPGSVVAAYAIGDLTRSWKLFEQLQPWVEEHGMRPAYDRERQLAPVLLDNERRGIRVDMAGLERDLPTCKAALRKAEDWLRKTLKIKDADFWNAKENAHLFNFDSDAHIAQALRRAGVVKEFAQTATGKESVSKKNLRIDHFSDPKVYYTIHYRNTLAAVTDRMEKFHAEGSQKGGYIFREWNQVRQGHGIDNTKGARSGRVTVGELANMAKRFGNKDPDYKHPKFLRVPDPPLARVYILPDEGDLLGHSDYDQQEMKLTAHYEDGDLAKKYREDPKTDIHEFVHDLILKVTHKDYNRDVVKTLDFRKLFGSGISGFAEQIREPYAVAQEIVRAWEEALPDVVALDDSLRSMFKAGDPIRTLGGRVYYCKPPSVAKKGVRKGQMVNYFYTALNYLIQPSAADQTKQALINYHNHPKRRSRLLCTVYDEINISMPAKLANKELAILRECMVGAFKLDVPVTTTLKMGPSWGELKKLED